MSDKGDGKLVYFKDLQREIDAWNMDFEKRMKKLKLDMKLIKSARKQYMLSQVELMKFVQKQYPDDGIPWKEAEPLIKKKQKKFFPLLHIKAEPGWFPEDADGVSFKLGSKKMSAGVKLKYDSKKGALKLEPSAGLKFMF